MQLLFRQCTSHKGLVRSRASFRTPPLSNRAIHRFFNQSLCPPGCTNHSSELSSLCLDSEVTSILTMASCIKEQVHPKRQCFPNLSRDHCTFCVSPLSNTPDSSHQTINRLQFGAHDKKDKQSVQWLCPKDSFEKHCCKEWTALWKPFFFYKDSF